MSGIDVYHIVLGSFCFTGALMCSHGAAHSGAAGKMGLWALSVLLVWVNAVFAVYNFAQLAG